MLKKVHKNIGNKKRKTLFLCYSPVFSQIFFKTFQYLVQIALE